ncbi:MAG: DUF11 domain-containing protein [Patescibacteria group bacterium]|nr:DUF11 domain-containing protein [Patescibacteria group bacterium]
MPPEKGDEIERLKKKLYSRGNKDKPMSDIRTPLSHEQADAPVSWSKAEDEALLAALQADTTKKKAPPIGTLMQEQKKKMSFAAKFLIGSFLFFVLAAGAAAYIFFGGGSLISPQNIDLQVVMPSLIDSGKASTFQIIIDNRNTSQLQLVDLILDYPDGTRDPTGAAALTQARQSIGTIGAGQQLKQTASAIFYGQQGAQEKVQVTLEYSVAGSNAVFQKQSEADFVIGSSPVSVSVSAPSAAVSNQSFPIDLTVQSNATTPLSNVVVQAQYPFGYSVQSATPQALAGGTFWQLGTLAPGASKTIHIVGSIDGQDGDQRVFRFLAGSNTDSTDTQVKVPLLTVPQTITVEKPFITGTIAVNGQSGKTISVTPGQPLEGTITWQNNLPTAITNAQLVLSFSGPALDKSSITSGDGFYQSQNSTITWSSAQDPSLAQVAPGQSGTLQFSFATLPPGSGNVLITNPTISLSLNVQGTEADQSGTPQQVTGAATAQVSVASMLSLAAQALHFTGGFTNTGPMPPKANADTSYTIVWTVKNSSNTIANATVSAVLPAYMRYVPGASGVSYDTGSRTVTWSLGDLNAGVGYSSAAKQVSFQVVLTPSASQVGSVPALTGEASLQGQDRFAQVGVSATAQAPTTALSGDTGFVSGMEIIAPN